jgi:hypothetical protein
MFVAESISVPEQLDVETEFIKRVRASGNRLQKQMSLSHFMSYFTPKLRGHWAHRRIAAKPGIEAILVIAFTPTAIKVRKRTKYRMAVGCGGLRPAVFGARARASVGVLIPSGKISTWRATKREKQC